LASLLASRLTTLLPTLLLPAHGNSFGACMPEGTAQAIYRASTAPAVAPSSTESRPDPV